MSIHISAKMRKKAYQGFFIITIISLAGVPTFFKLIFNTGQSVAVVDGMSISPHDYQAAIIKKEQQLATLRSRLGVQIDDETLRAFGINTNTHESALDDLITEKLLQHVARSLAIKLHADYVAHVVRNPQILYQLIGENLPFELFDMQRGGIDLARLKQFLRRQGKTIESFDAMIEAHMEIATVLNLVKEATIISSADIKASELQKYASKTFAITRASYAPFITLEEKKPATPQEIQAHFAAQNAASHRYWAPEKRQGTLWKLSLAGDTAAEDRFMKEIQGVLNSPADIFARFAEQKQASKQSLSTSQGKEGKAQQALLSLNQGRRVAYVDHGVGYVVELTRIEKSSPLPLEQVQQAVLKDIYRERAEKRVAALLTSADSEQIKKEILAGNIKIETVTIHPDREQSKQTEQLQKEGIPLERLGRMFAKKQSFIGATEDAGYKVELIEVGALNQELAQKNKRAINASLEQAMSNQLTYDFIASLREHAKIVMNRSLLKGM